MATEPSRSDVFNAEVEALGEALRATRAKLTTAADLDALTAAPLDARRAELQRARASFDLASIDRLGRPS